MKYIIRLFKMAKPWYGYLVISTFALLVMTAISLLIPDITERILKIMEEGNFEESINKIIIFVLILLGVFALRAVCQFLTGYLSHVASWKLVAHVRSKLYSHFQQLPMGYYHDKQTGQLMSRIVNDTTTFENMIAHAIPDLITNIVTLIGVLVILLIKNPVLTGLICIPIPFLLGMSFIIRRIRKYFRIGQEKIAELNGILQDNFSGMKEIQIFNKQEFELNKVHEKSKEHSSAILRALFFSGILNPAVGFITSLGTVIVLIGGPILVLNTDMKISEVVAFLLYLGLFYGPISQLTRLVEDMQMALSGAERVFEVLDTEPSIKNVQDAQDVGRLSGQVSFEKVYFSYKDNLPVLEDISFDVKPGEMIALVGATGVGKTTISALISRFYDTDDGRITMDGIDIKDMTLESLRNQLSLVLQDVFLFNGTISENISYGTEDATPEQIAQAARIACIAEYIESLPEGYETLIGERGMRLSGGQKQRISIARSILRNSPILIMDEATSSVDTETEKEIQQAINNIAGTRTLIVIAHRLSTIRNADKIIVLEEGKISEQGKHAELIQQNGTYSKLCSMQG